MRHAMGNEYLGAEQLFVLRMLQLSSRRSALLEQRAEAAAGTSPQPLRDTTAGPSKRSGTPRSNSIDEKERQADDSIVVGTVLLMNGEAAPKDGSYNAYRPRSAALPPRPELTTTSAFACRSNGDSPVKSIESGGGDTTSPNAAAALAKDAEPISPQSPMRRMMDLKGARPVRRPRGADVIPPHRRTDSDGLPSRSSSTTTATTMTNAALGSAGSSGRVARADAAKAALQREVVRRTLSSLGLPVSADVSVAMQRARRAAAATPEDGKRTEGESRASAATDSPTTGDTDFPAVDTSGSEEGTAHTPRDVAMLDGSTRGIDKCANRATHPRTASSAAEAGKDEATASDAPKSPAVTQSFGTFLQRLCPTSTSAGTAASAATTGGNANSAAVSTTNAKGPLTTHVTPAQKLETDGPLRRREQSTPLVDVDSGAASSSAVSERSATSSSAGAPQASGVPPPPPPPYAEAPLPHANLGAGTFTTAQELVAHLRLSQRWTIVATRRWYRPVVDSSSGNDAPPSPTAADLQHLQQRQLSALLACRRSSTSRAAIAAAARCVPILVDGDATLVSDRVDAVLPTWAYLSSHSADAAAATILSSLMAQPHALGAESPVSAASSATHRQRRSHNSSFASSVTSGSPASMLALPENMELLAEERLDRHACLFPYDLAEACAMARLRRRRLGSNDHSRSSSSSRSHCSLHLLRLELLLDVQQIPPTVRTVSAEERQAMLERALEDFAESGVLPTTVLRSVLNDAALRLLCSVDEEVLTHIAQGGVEKENSSSAQPSPPTATATATASPASPAPSTAAARVVPLSLHVHTVQGDLCHSGNTSPSVVPQPSRSLATGSVHSTAASTISGDTDSIRPVSVAAGPSTPTQLILTVLVHLSTPPTPGSPEEPLLEEAEGGPSAGKQATPPTSASSRGSQDVPASTLTEEAALAMAQAVVPHLFPLPFAASRYATRLSVSSAVDYDTLSAASDCGGSAEATPPSLTSSPSLRGPPSPWTWVDVELSDLRAACGMPELKRTLTGIHGSAPPYSARSLRSGGTGGAATLESMESSITSHPKSRTRRSKKKPAAAANVAAAADVAPEAPPVVMSGGAPAPSQLDTRAEEKPPLPPLPPASSSSPPNAAAEEHQQQEGEAKRRASDVVGEAMDDGEEESFDVAGISDGQLRWDSAKETAELTAVTEAVQLRLEAICGHAQVLGQLMRTFEVAFEEKKATKKSRKTSPAQRSYTEEMRARATAVAACAVQLLTSRTLHGVPDASANAAAAAEAAATRPFLPTLFFAAVAASSRDAQTEAAAACGGFSEEALSAWFEQCAAHVAREVCAPLEQLEALILDSTGSAVTSPVAATIASVSVGEPNGSVSDDLSAGAVRHVIGAQVMLKETRRQRRSAAAAARLSQTLMSEAAGGAAAATPSLMSSLVPALTVAKAMVQLCKEMSRQPTAAPLPHNPQQPQEQQQQQGLVGGGKGAGDEDDGGADGSGSVAHQPLVSLYASRHSRHQRSLSWSSAASVRVLSAAGVAQTLQERIAALHKVLQRVHQQLEAEERRWATLPGPLDSLQSAWHVAQGIVGQEAVARAELQATRTLEEASVAAAVEARQARERRAKEEEEEKIKAAAAQAAQAAEAAAEEERRAAEARLEAAAASAKAIEAAQTTATMTATPARKEEAPEMMKETEVAKTDEAGEQGAVDIDPATATITIGTPEQMGEDDALGSERGAGEEDAAHVASPSPADEHPPEEASQEERASPAAPAVASAGDVREEGGEVEAEDGDDAAENADDSDDEAAVSEAAPSEAATTATESFKPKRAAPPPPLSRASPRPAPSAAAPSAKASNNATVATTATSTTSQKLNAGQQSIKKVRGRNKATQPRSAAGRSSATSSPTLSTISGRGFDGVSASPPTSAVAAMASTASVSSSGSAAAGRAVPQKATGDVLAQYIDVVLIRQAAPFMVVGTLLFFIFLLL